MSDITHRQWARRYIWLAIFSIIWWSLWPQPLANLSHVYSMSKLNGDGSWMTPRQWLVWFSLRRVASLNSQSHRPYNLNWPSESWPAEKPFIRRLWRVAAASKAKLWLIQFNARQRSLQPKEAGKRQTGAATGRRQTVSPCQIKLLNSICSIIIAD